jgi:hypothetical protein
MALPKISPESLIGNMSKADFDRKFQTELIKPTVSFASASQRSASSSQSSQSSSQSSSKSSASVFAKKAANFIANIISTKNRGSIA